LRQIRVELEYALDDFPRPIKLRASTIDAGQIHTNGAARRGTPKRILPQR